MENYETKIKKGKNLFKGYENAVMNVWKILLEKAQALVTVTPTCAFPTIFSIRKLTLKFSSDFFFFFFF